MVGTGVAGMEKFGEISGKDFFATAAESAPTAPSEPQKNELKKRAQKKQINIRFLHTKIASSRIGFSRRALLSLSARALVLWSMDVERNLISTEPHKIITFSDLPQLRRDFNYGDGRFAAPLVFSLVIVREASKTRHRSEES